MKFHSQTLKRSPTFGRSFSENDTGTSDHVQNPMEVEDPSRGKSNNGNVNKLKSSPSNIENTSKGAHKSPIGTRATDSARVTKFTKELSAPTVILGDHKSVHAFGTVSMSNANLSFLKLYPLQNGANMGYAPPNSDRREGVLRRKRLEYFDCVAQFYDIPDTERSDDEINMLRQIAVDCPRTVPDVTFFQQVQVQKSLERILYTCQLDLQFGSVDDWSISDITPEKISDIEADCYWCLSKLLDGMQDHYTFAQPGIQRLVFKLKELVRRIDEPVSKHIEEQGLEFLQFAFCWFNCVLIREIPFHLVTRLWDTYLAEGDALPDFLVYIFASFLLTNKETELPGLCNADSTSGIDVRRLVNGNRDLLRGNTK
ncbi:Rab-GAP TBC domain-containing protein [Citrus sinensis]|uniref:Rab-GAP TBC domain-containing protein n=1 Tax=Citrus sinensis TaxID=2711 RepID=A0ACB8MCN1_CITSI|nr:Rab-GAP TBC domain-containing protein [Citrus sinensis]